MSGISFMRVLSPEQCMLEKMFIRGLGFGPLQHVLAIMPSFTVARGKIQKVRIPSTAICGCLTPWRPKRTRTMAGLFFAFLQILNPHELRYFIHIDDSDTTIAETPFSYNGTLLPGNRHCQPSTIARDGKFVVRNLRFSTYALISLV